MGSLADHKAQALAGSGSIADRELGFWAESLTKNGNVKNVAPSGLWTAPGVVSSVSVAIANGVCRLLGLYLPPCTIDRLGCEVTVAGSAGTSFVRMVMWDSENDLANKVVADSGRIAADVVGLKNVPVNVQHPGGFLWLGAIPQGAPAANPSLRCVSTSNYQPFSSAQFGSAFVSCFEAAAMLDAPSNNPGGAWTVANPPIVTVRIA